MGKHFLRAASAALFLMMTGASAQAQEPTLIAAMTEKADETPTPPSAMVQPRPAPIEIATAPLEVPPLAVEAPSVEDQGHDASATQPDLALIATPD